MLLWPFMPGGRFFLLKLVFWLVVLAGLWQLFIGDIDAFEAETGFFDRIGTWIFNGLLALMALGATLMSVSVFFPRAWGPKSGVAGAIGWGLLAAFLWRVLWLGGV
jgi:hypothetical protein